MQYSSSPEMSSEKLTLRHFQTETDYHQPFQGYDVDQQHAALQTYAI